MTLEELKKQIEAIEAQIAELNINKEELQKQYIATLPYKVGDLVEVKVRDFSLSNTPDVFKTYQVYISWIGFQWSKYFRIKFKKVKKDGTMSGQSASIYYYESIQVIKPA